jgi:hypothetical protein
MGGVLRATYARRGIIISRWYPSVETILELGEISRHVFYVHRPIGANQSRLDVPKHGVGPFEGWLCNRLRAAASLNLSVCASSRCDGGETGQRKRANSA